MLVLGGAFTAAGELLDDLDKLVDATKQIWVLPQVYRLRALLDQRVATGRGAEVWLEKSLAQARDYGETYFELRAARDLGRIYAARGEPQRARELVAPVCGRVTGSPENFDLEEARSLLRQAESSG
jgi:hypothetical protein